MNKKASSILVMIFELMAVIVIITILISYAKAVGESDSTIKIRTANNIQMMVDTLVGVPGAAVVEYPDQIGNLSLALYKDRIEVFPPGQPKKLRLFRKFYLPKDYSAVGGLERPKRFCLEKKDKTITLRECTKEEN